MQLLTLSFEEDYALRKVHWNWWTMSSSAVPFDKAEFSSIYSAIIVVFQLFSTNIIFVIFGILCFVSKIHWKHTIRTGFNDVKNLCVRESGLEFSGI